MEWSRHLCLKSVDHICQYSLFLINSLTLVYVFILIVTPHCFDYYWSINFEIEKYKSSSFVVLFLRVFYYSVPLAILYKLQNKLISFYKRSNCNSQMECIELVCQFEENSNLNNIKYFNTQACVMSSYSFRYFKIILTMFCSSQSTNLRISWWNLFLSIYYFDSITFENNSIFLLLNVLDLIRCLYYINWDNCVGFLLYSFKVVYYINF